MIAPWRIFMVEVARVRPLSPSFVKVTFTGKDLDCFADNGFDQRCKLILPVPEYGFDFLPTDLDWYAQWRALPGDKRNPIRTYTVRAVRQQAAEVDIDIVLHGDTGPAGRWASAVAPGDRAALLGPDAGFTGSHGGLEFNPPLRATSVLLAGDETAVPAVLSIVERMAPGLRADVFLEVPHDGDCLGGEGISWLPRNGKPGGSRLIPAVTALLPPRPTSPTFQETGPPRSGLGPSFLEDADVDEEPLWEVPDGGDGSFYAWIAGEASMVKTLRRHLVAERGVDRRSVAFMGYWRLGRPEC